MITSTLDCEQSRAASADPGQTTVVIAGPGSGKSHVVGELARNLVAEHGLWPDEILVISFSRAAVQVVGDRTSEITEEGSSVSTATIDSLAAQIVRDHSHDDSPLAGFDKTVERALSIARLNPELIASGVEHVIIDEVQDVVGLRAVFVFEFLKVVVEKGAGFTLLGDPLQSLYDFQLKGQYSWTCSDLLDHVERKFSPRHITLGGDYRSRTPDARHISAMRPELLALADHVRLHRLRSTAANLAPLGRLDDDAIETLAAWPGTTALLCDTNARAGLVINKLAHSGTPARLVTAADKSPAPAWIAECLGNAQGRSLSLEEFLTRAQSVGPDATLKSAWRTLMTIADSDRVLDIPTLVDRLTHQELASLPPDSDAPIVVSTVHRAKGLEFENVVLVDPDDWWNPDEDHARTSRMFYVALSRAHSRVSYVRDVPVAGWFKVPIARDGLWVRGPRGRRGGINGLFMEPSLARALGPSATLSQEVVGHPVKWEESAGIEDVDGEVVPTWLATVSNVTVARTGEAFGRFMLSRGRDNRPSLSGGYVEGLETVFKFSHGASLTNHRMWLGARVSGIVDLKWR